jgi:FeS assembly SUF system protein
LPDRTIELIDPNSPQGAPRVPSDTENTASTGSAASTAGAIFERCDPVKTLTMRPGIVEALSTVFDPEIPVNIYELGLIYDIAVDPDGAVGIRMTLTAPGCPAAQNLPVEVADRLRRVPGVSDARVEIVWDPPWDRDRMSPAAKLQLGMF